jgi:hypothetical protein
VVEASPATGTSDAPDVFDEQVALRQQEANERSAVQAEKDRRAAQISQVGDRSARRHPNLYAMAINETAGIRVEREEERTVGKTSPRVLLSFAEDKLPNKAETALLRQEGLVFESDDKAWAMPDTEQNRLLAMHAFNGILKLRGVERKIAVPSR